MKEWIGKSAKIIIIKDKIKLYFSAKMILDITQEHITFIDKYNFPYTFHKSLVEEIQPLINERNKDMEE